MHEKSGYLNLSDGGHIENLALYAILRRRCKFIMVIDGGMEPGMECADLMLACTGSEPGYVVDYARQFPDFPHQTTSDQIYDEAQFEVYRRLGEYAAESLFRPEISDPYCADSTEVARWR